MDFTNLKKLSIGGVELKQLLINGIQVWKAITFTNQVPISTDTDGSIFNGVGYIENRRLSSSGGLSSSAQNGSVTTGFIPFPDGDATVVRLKGVEFVPVGSDSSKHYYVVFYDANKKAKANCYFSAAQVVSGTYSHIVTMTRDADGVETITVNQSYGTSNSFLQFVRNEAKFIRITAYGKGADFIVTINEEIA